MNQNPKIHKSKLRNQNRKEHRQIIKQFNYKGKHIYNNQKLKQKNQDKKYLTQDFTKHMQIPQIQN